MADEKGSNTSTHSSRSRTSTTSSFSIQKEENDQVDEKKTPPKEVQPKPHIHPHHEHRRKNHHHDHHHHHHHHKGHHHRNHHHGHHHHGHHHRVSPVPPPPPHHNRPLVVGEDPKIDKPMHIDEWVEKTVEIASKSKEIKKEKERSKNSKSHGGGLKGGSPHYHLEWQAIFRGRKMSSSSSSSGSQPISGLMGGRRPKQLLYDVDSLPDMDTERRFPRSKSKTEVRPLVQAKPRDDERHGLDDEAGSVYSWASSQSSSMVSASAENPAESAEEPPVPSETLIFHQNQKYSVGVEFRDLRFYGPWSGKVFLLLGINHILTALLAAFMLRFTGEGVALIQVIEALLWTATIISILGYIGVWLLTWENGANWSRMVQFLPLLATWVFTAGESASLVVLIGVHSQFIPAFFALSGEAYLVLSLISFTTTMETIGWNLAIVATVSIGFFTLALLLTATLFGHFSFHILGASLPALGHTLLVVWELGEFVSGERLELRANHLFLTTTLLPLSAILNPPAVMVKRLRAKRHRRTVPHIPKKK